MKGKNKLQELFQDKYNADEPTLEYVCLEFDKPYSTEYFAEGIGPTHEITEIARRSISPNTKFISHQPDIDCFKELQIEEDYPELKTIIEISIPRCNRWAEYYNSRAYGLIVKLQNTGKNEYKGFIQVQLIDTRKS